MYKWLLIALASVGFVGVHHWQSRSVGPTGTSPVTVYAISNQTCSIEQQKADQLVAELAGAGLPYTLYYVDQDGAAQAEFNHKVREFLTKQGTVGHFSVRFPVVAVRDRLLFDRPALETIQKQR